MTDVVRVLGMPQLLARFARGAALGEAAASAAVNVLAIDVAIGAQERAPVVTGRLRDSIEAHDGKVTVGAPYGVFVEYGTSDMAAEPFLRPAADTVDGSHATEMAASVLRAL